MSIDLCLDTKMDSPANGEVLGLALPTLVASRLCHDLVGPVGAIANGVDLMREAGGGEEETALIAQSVARATALLRALRLAFGQATAEAQHVARGTLVDTMAPVMASRRVDFQAIGADGPPLTAPEARLGALMLLTGRLVLGLSGRIELVFSQDTSLPLRVAVDGSKATLDPRRVAWLSGDFSEMPDSREVEFAVLPHAAAAMGVLLTHRDESGIIALCARADTDACC